MRRKKRVYRNKEFKFKIAIEAIKGDKTITELAEEYKVHANQITTWKKQQCQLLEVPHRASQYIQMLKDNKIEISMNGVGRATDNIAVERFFRTLKQDEVYLNEYEILRDAKIKIAAYMKTFNSERPHQTHDGLTPDQAYYSGLNSCNAA